MSDPPVVQASAVPVSAVEGAAFAGVALATFTDPGGAEPNPSDPTGSIADHYTVVSIDIQRLPKSATDEQAGWRDGRIAHQHQNHRRRCGRECDAGPAIATGTKAPRQAT